MQNVVAKRYSSNLADRMRVRDRQISKIKNIVSLCTKLPHIKENV